MTMDKSANIVIINVRDVMVQQLTVQFVLTKPEILILIVTAKMVILKSWLLYVELVIKFVLHVLLQHKTAWNV